MNTENADAPPPPDDPAGVVRGNLSRILRPQCRGVGLMIPKGVDPATITPPELTPIDDVPADATA